MTAMNRPLPREDLEHVLQHTRDLWEEIRGKRIFITGGTGFFGVWLLETFVFANEQLGLDARVTALTRNPENSSKKIPRLASHPAIDWVKGDVRNFGFPTGEYSHVIHSATETNSAVAPMEPQVLIDANVSATRRVLEFAEGAGAGRFLFTSSGAVYGRQPPDVTHLGEDYSGRAAVHDDGTGYGRSKHLSEMLCESAAREHGLGAVIARCFAFVGPLLPLDTNYVIGNFIRDALNGGPIRIHGDGTPRRSYLYTADLAAWLWTLMLKGRPGQAYNVGSNEDFSIEQIARLVGDAVNPGKKITVAKKPVPGQPCQRYVPSTDHAKNELGLHTWINIRESIRRTIEWHSN